MRSAIACSCQSPTIRASTVRTDPASYEGSGESALTFFRFQRPITRQRTVGPEKPLEQRGQGNCENFPAKWIDRRNAVSLSESWGDGVIGPARFERTEGDNCQTAPHKQTVGEPVGGPRAMQHTWQRRGARGLFTRITGGIICPCALGVALATAGAFAAPTARSEKPRQRPGARPASHTTWTTSRLAHKPAWSTTTTNGALLMAGRARESAVLHINGQLYTQPPGGSVASPAGTTYSVHHRLGALIDSGSGPQQTCFDIGDLNDPNDNIVTFDGVGETLRKDVFGTAATVVESDTPQTDGSRLIVITTSAPTGTDLFPAGVIIGTDPLTDACFSIGLDDPLDWEGLDTVAQADIAFLKDGVTQTSSDITGLFSAPWDGKVDVILVGGAGQGYNGVRIQIKSNKNITPPNDLCADAIPITDGIHSFSTVGAGTDGVAEIPECSFFGFSNINADIWFSYTATCTGEMILDLCNSNYDTKVAVYNGCTGRCPPESAPVACNDDWCGLKSSLGPDLGRQPVPVVQGSCYTIRLGGTQGLSGSGNGSVLIECRSQSDIQAACCLAGQCTMQRQSECESGQGTWFPNETCSGGTFTCPIPPPSNDECAGAIPLTTDVPFNGTSIGSTGTDISACGDGDSNDVWHSWTADCSGFPTFETCGSFFDTTLSVYDACGGSELKCNDDSSCGIRSRIDDLVVTEGQTYYLRVAGFGGQTGGYRLQVTGCRHACCLANASPNCGLVTPDDCVSLGGVPLIGSICLGDMDGNGVDDACEGCPPDPQISNSDPFTGTVDARRPFAQKAPMIREGIGSADEPVLLLLTPNADGLETCFSLCETAPDPDLGANAISSVVRLPSGLYQLQLDHAIPAGEATTLSYTGDGSFIHAIAHPGNVNGDAFADPQDVISLMDCCLDQTCTPPWADRSCDIDRSGKRTPLDILTTIDLLQGSGAWSAWNQTPKPPVTGCP